MGACNSCDREHDIDRKIAASREVEKRINALPAPADHFTPCSKRSSAHSGPSSHSEHFRFNFPIDDPQDRSSHSVKTCDVEKFYFGPKDGEPGIRPQSGVYRIPNQFSPPDSPHTPSDTLSLLRLKSPEVFYWTCSDVISWWCNELPDEAIQYAPLIEDSQIKGEDLLAMDVELIMSFQIGKKLAEKIYAEIQKLLNPHSRSSTTGETQFFSDSEFHGDSIPPFWKTARYCEQNDDEGALKIRSPLTLLPPNSPRMVAEAEASRESFRIEQLEKQILVLQEQLSAQHRPLSPVGKNKVRTPQSSKGKSATSAKKGRRKKSKQMPQSRLNGKFQVHKEGPIEIGRVENWKPACYDINDDGNFLQERISTKRQYKNQQVYKAGPRDVEPPSDSAFFPTGWKPYVHNREDSGRDFLAERLPRPKPIRNKVSRKAGPRGETEVMRKRSSLVRSSMDVSESTSSANIKRNRRRSSTTSKTSTSSLSSFRTNSFTVMGEPDHRSPVNYDAKRIPLRSGELNLECGGCEAPYE